MPLIDEIANNYSIMQNEQRAQQAAQLQQQQGQFALQRGQQQLEQGKQNLAIGEQTQQLNEQKLQAGQSKLDMHDKVLEIMKETDPTKREKMLNAAGATDLAEGIRKRQKDIINMKTDEAAFKKEGYDYAATVAGQAKQEKDYGKQIQILKAGLEHGNQIGYDVPLNITQEDLSPENINKTLDSIIAGSTFSSDMLKARLKGAKDYKETDWQRAMRIYNDSRSTPSEKKAAGIKIGLVEKPKEEGPSPFEKALGPAQAKAFTKENDDVRKVSTALTELQKSRDLVNSGIISGAGANVILAVGKGLQRIGIHFADDAIANTEAFVAAQGKQVATVIKEFGSGTGLSDADREYAQKIVGGQITLSEKSIKAIITMNEIAMRNRIEKFNERARKVDQVSHLPYSTVIPLPQDLTTKKGLSKDTLEGLKKKYPNRSETEIIEAYYGS